MFTVNVPVDVTPAVGVKKSGTTQEARGEKIPLQIFWLDDVK